MKRCSKCKVEKDSSEFSKAKEVKDMDKVFTMSSWGILRPRKRNRRMGPGLFEISGDADTYLRRLDGMIIAKYAAPSHPQTESRAVLI